MRRLGKIGFTVLTLCCALILAAVGYCERVVPEAFTVAPGESLHIGSIFDSRPTDSTLTAASIRAEESYQASLRLFGVLPVKTVTVTVSDVPSVTVCGTPFGIKLYTDGVLIVGADDVETAAGACNPATAAGLRVGDTIVAIDGKKMTTNEDVAAAINGCDGHALTVRIRRDGVDFDAAFTPVRQKDGGFRAGLWVRDSTAGIGMLTFYDPARGVFAGLGHAVSDSDTGTTFSLSGGEIVPATVFGVKKSVVGTPGELEGSFALGTLGRLSRNGEDGLYGILTALPTEGITMPVATKQQVHTGAAQVLTTVDGTHPALYTVEIEQIRYHSAAVTRHMNIRVTDPALLAQTGGIVQGMSGSPLIQNGKLIGAITHVLVDDPTTGYAIFAENMLETAQTIANKGEIKDAS